MSSSHALFGKVSPESPGSHDEVSSAANVSPPHHRDASQLPPSPSHGPHGPRGGGNHLSQMKALHEDNYERRAKMKGAKEKDRQLALATGATMQDVEEFREIFELVDLDKGGSIDADELRKLTQLLNMETSEDELEGMLSEIDTTGSGEIFFPDFVRTMLKKPNVTYTKKDVTDAFYELAGRPPNNYGLINASVLEQRLMDVGYEHERLTKQQVEDILGMSEVDEKGDINYSEFVSLMMGETRERRLTSHEK